MQEQQQLPPGATPIDVDEMFAAIGELYFQVRVLRKMVQQQQQQQQASSPNGVAGDAVQLQS
jgi:hypothetical protein